jgi:hypothetical protein
MLKSSSKAAVGLGPTTIALQTEGAIDSAAVAALLNQFDIFLSGEFTLAPSLVRLPYNARSIAKIDLARPIELNWSGGQVSYILANQFNQVTLPSLQGHLVADPNRGGYGHYYPPIKQNRIAGFDPAH